MLHPPLFDYLMGALQLKDWDYFPGSPCVKFYDEFGIAYAVAIQNLERDISPIISKLHREVKLTRSFKNDNTVVIYS